MRDEMKEIIICKHCGKPEYYGEMRWLNGFCGCRDCYKQEFEKTYKRPYIWSDLNGKRPSIEEYNSQENKNV